MMIFAKQIEEADVLSSRDAGENRDIRFVDIVTAETALGKAALAGTEANEVSKCQSRY